MLHRHESQPGGGLPRRGPRAGVEKRLSTQQAILAMTVVALAFAGRSAPVAANEPMLLLAPASAPDDAVTRSEVMVSSHTDTLGRLVREVSVRLVVIDETPLLDREITPDSWPSERQMLRNLAKEALYDAFQTAEAAFDHLLEPADPPEIQIPQLSLVSQVAASANFDAMELGVLAFESDVVSRPMIGANSVPEPSALVLFVAASIPLWSRERRRRLVG